MRKVEKKMPLEALTKVFNPRLVQNETFTDLLTGPESILEVGLKSPIVVIGSFDNDVPVEDLAIGQIIKGHRRKGAIEHVFNTNRELFDKLFGKGIPCLVLENVSERNRLEIAELLNDHGEVQGLRHKFELACAVESLLRAGASEKIILGKLYNQFAAFGNPDADKMTEFEKLVLAGKHKEALDVLQPMFHGQFQKYERYFDLPPYVLNVWRAKLENRALYDHEIPAWLPNMDTTLWDAGSTTLVKKLDDAFNKDHKTKDQYGLSIYTKLNPGPAFLNALAGILKKASEEPDEKGTREKAIPASAMIELAEKCSSNGIKQVIMHCAGKLEADIVGIDNLHLQAEIVVADERSISEIELAWIETHDDTETFGNQSFIYIMDWMKNEYFRKALTPAQ